MSAQNASRAQFRTQDIQQMEQRYRAQLINCLSGVKSANLIGTKSSTEQENLSIVSSVVHLGAHPPLVGMVIRPRSVPRHTFENLTKTGEFTINHVHTDICRQAHQTSARYDVDISEFEETKLTPLYLHDFSAPFVQESKIRMGVHFLEVKPIERNGTEFVIGEIVLIDIPEDIICNDGHLDIAAAGTVGVTGLDCYQRLKTLSRFSYAKPDRKIEELPLSPLRSRNSEKGESL